MLETKLKAERQRYEQLRERVEREAREQTQLKEKMVQEINMKYESLQQQYKFLNSQMEDNKEECTRDKAKQSAEMVQLQNKVKSLQSQAIEKDKNLDMWKVFDTFSFFKFIFRIFIVFEIFINFRYSKILPSLGIFPSFQRFSFAFCHFQQPPSTFYPTLNVFFISSTLVQIQSTTTGQANS